MLRLASHLVRVLSTWHRYKLKKPTRGTAQLVGNLGLPRAMDRSLFRLALLGAVNRARVWYRKGKKNPRDVARTIIRIFRGNAMR